MRCSDAPEARAPAARPLAARAADAFDLLADKGEMRGAALGLAVSGGSDSLALLHLAHDWSRRNGQTLSVASVDHGLRPEAAAEAEQVGRLCASLNIDHAVLVWKPQGGAAQDDTRRARHALLADWARERGIATLALGHTADDRLETFLIRVRAGSGWWGLAAPLPSSASSADPHLRLIRPLLAFPRQLLRDFLNARDVTWIDDPSNFAPRFERVRVRALVSRVPPETRASALRTLDRLASLRAAATREAAALVPYGAVEGDRLLIPLGLLAQAGPVARLRLMEAAVRIVGGARHPPPLAPLEKLAAALGAAETPTAVNVGGALLKPGRNAGENRVLAIGREPPRRGAASERQPERPDWSALAPLLADPRLAALMI